MISNNQSTFEVKILNSKFQIYTASLAIRMKTRMSHHDSQKNWDANIFCKELVNLDRDSKVLDAGSGKRAFLAKIATEMGFKHVDSIDIDNLSEETSKEYPGINHYFAPIEKSGLPENNYDVIGLLSVIEHVKSDKVVIEEISRILRPGGKLLLSTDFWPQPIDTTGIYPYGKDAPEMRIYNLNTVRSLFDLLEEQNFVIPKQAFDLLQQSSQKLKQKVIHWDRVNRSYTFLYLKLTKKGG